MYYKLYGKYRGVKEILDTAETLEEAEYLLAEYRLAFGSGWLIWYTTINNED